jgi:CheY-like chemotaxis protein
VSVSILVVDDEPDVVLLFRRRFRREVRDDAYVMHFANSGEDALQHGEIRATVRFRRQAGAALGALPRSAGTCMSS